MKRVTGIGGVFFKCKDAAVTKAWYEKHLGIPAGSYGHTFNWQDGQDAGQSGTTSWSTFPEKSDYFGPGDQPFMINYRVDDLVTLIAALREEGVEIAGELQEFEYGKFAWVVDCDGRRVELWEPVDQPLIDFHG
jgi:predicted enzyme related to lactoylglutathione lyase